MGTFDSPSRKLRNEVVSQKHSFTSLERRETFWQKVGRRSGPGKFTFSNRVSQPATWRKDLSIAMKVGNMRVEMR
jgi:hypothetical protein